jgi:hypothetical protein
MSSFIPVVVVTSSSGSPVFVDLSSIRIALSASSPVVDSELN